MTSIDDFSTAVKVNITPRRAGRANSEIGCHVREHRLSEHDTHRQVIGLATWNRTGGCYQHCDMRSNRCCLARLRKLDPWQIGFRRNTSNCENSNFLSSSLYI